MARRITKTQSEGDRIPFRMHPRVFSALGADLVTNDVVAVIELVKNSYDAFARNVWVRFRTDPSHGTVLEIEDDGSGMTREIIKDVWCLVATPFKERNRLAKTGKKTRRVVGEKGLGRFSAARLGERFRMLTQAQGSPCWEVTVNWSAIAEGDELSASFARCREYSNKSPFRKSGTRLEISGLRAEWDNERVADLEENLARLISPFATGGDFDILLSRPGEEDVCAVEIKAPAFLSKPKYAVRGSVDTDGNIKCTYRFRPLSDGAGRKKTFATAWEQVNDAIELRTGKRLCEQGSRCGPLSFEIRAWDTDAEGTSEIEDRFRLQKNSIRRAIRAHKGISVYRDDILVLPKSDKARDWLGLDLRRISKVGTRLSTSQIVGHVSISADDNPDIDDTSDRERLASCPAVHDFEEILVTIVALLENERDEDRIKREHQRPMDDLFAELSTKDLVAEVIGLADERAQASETIPLLREFSKRLDDARKTIQERFVYYSRLATVGTIAQMLVHEIRNRTTAFGTFLEFIKSRFGPFKDKDIEEEYRCTDNAVNALERLADTFAPLASRAFRRRKRDAVLENRIRECLELQRGELKRKGIRCLVPESAYRVATDPGELDAILLNLITNAAYWLGEVSKGQRALEFRVVPISEGSRIRIWVHDTGPGLHADVVEKVFWPGVTRKPGGIGMGLTVASELVAEYGGRMSVKHPGTKGGASFAFDLPLKQ